MTKEHGGMAFPHTYETEFSDSLGNYHKGTATQFGMTLREWYAGMAMQGLLSSEPHNVNYEFEDETTVSGNLAKDAFRVADAMIAASKEADHD